MSLSKPGGFSVVETKVVQKVSDLPSPLSMQGDERFIVKEDDGVYAINRKTNMWECVGSVKKAGGRRPEDLAAHLDSKLNPHGTNVQQTYEADPHVAITEKGGELTLEAASPAVKALLRLLARGGAALKVGPDAGKVAASVWINAGKKGQKLPQVAVVDDAGNPVALIDSDGNIELAGSATVRGGFKGKAAFEDEITAAEGVFGADNPDGDGLALVLGSGTAKGKAGPVVLSPGRKQKVFITETGLGVGTDPKAPLDVAGNIKFSGYVQADANPDEDKKYTVGTAKRRWKGAFAGSLDLDAGADTTLVSAKIDKAQTKNVVQFTKQAEGDVLVLDGDGDLGLGAPKPERRLDVRGSGIAIGAPVGKARTSLADNGDGSVVLSFNRNPDDSPEDASLVSWALVPGGKDDYFAVRRRAKNGEWQSLLHVTPGGAKIIGGLRVDELQAPDVQTSRVASAQAAITLGETLAFEAAEHSFKGKSATFDLTDDSAFEVSIGNRLLLGVHKSAIVGSGSLGTSEAPWSGAHIGDELTVAGTKFTKGLIESDMLELSAKKGAVGIRQNLALLDGKFNVVFARSGRLTLVGEIPEKAVYLDMNKKTYGLHFSDGNATISGVGDLEVKGLDTEELTVKGSAKFGETAVITKDGMTVDGAFAVSGLRFEKLEDDVVLNGIRAETKVKIPAGVRIEAVVVTVADDVKGARFWQAGDASSVDRFVSATTKLQAGQIVTGLNHCDRGQSVQQTDGAVAITTDSPASGKFHVAVFYVQAR